MSYLDGIDGQQIINLFSDPVKFCESFMRNPNDKEQPLTLRSYQSEIISQTRNYKKIILRYGRRMGKCERGNSLILNDLGELVKVKSLVNSSDFGVISLNDDYSLEKTTKTKCVSNGVKPIYRAQTKSGRRIEITANHPLLTVSGWKNLEDISIGEAIAVPARIDINSTTEIADEKVKLLSYLLSDGCVTRHISFGNELEPILSEFKDCVSYFNCETRINKKYGKYEDYCVRGKKELNGRYATNHILSYLRELNLFGSHTKFIPNEILRLSKRQQALFLSRLYSCDGWASVSKSKRRSGNCEIGYCSVSEDLAYGVAHLLTRFGIRHFITEKNVKYKGTLKKAWQICIRTKSDILKFIDEIGIFGKEAAVANVKKNTLLKGEKETYFDSLPTVDTIDAFSIEQPRKHNIRKQYKRTSKFKFIDYAKGHDNSDLLSLCSSDIFFDDIVSIDYICDEETFDLEVWPHHNFIANDIVIHNSVTMCADTIYWCAANPLVQMIEGKAQKQKPFRVLIATPYETQITELWNTYTALIADSPLLQELVLKIRASDPPTISFTNGSRIEGHTIGISSSNKGTSLRSLSADMVFLDEMDFIPRDIIEKVIMPIWTTHTNTMLRICSTPSGQRSLFWEWCWPQSVDITTLAGIKKIKDIKVGDLVFGKDSEPEKVTALFKQSFKGKLVEFRTGATETIACTPNHELFLFGKGFTRAENVTTKDFILVPEEHYPYVPIKINIKPLYHYREYKREKILSRSKEVGPTQASRDFNISRSQVTTHNRNEKLYPETWMFDNRKRNHIKRAQNFVDSIPTMKEKQKFFKFLGYYLAEGCILKDFSNEKYKVYSGIQLSFNKSENDYIEECCSIARKILEPESIKLIQDRKDNSVSIIIYGSWISYLFLTLCGEYSGSKTIHPNILSYKEYTKFILEGYINGDGWALSTGKFAMVSTSKELARQLYSISVLNKIPVTFHTTEKQEQNHNTSYTIYQLQDGVYKYKYDADNRLYIKVDEISLKEYDDYVYNFETERTHTYNVQGICSHNCTRAKELGWLGRHYPSWHPDNTNWMSIEQAKEQGVPVTDSTEFQVRAITDSATYDREYGAEFGEEFGGVYKQSLLDKCLVKYDRGMNLDNTDIFDPGFKQNLENLYIIGIDWNSYINGGQIVMIEYCRAPTFHTYYDDEKGEDTSINFTGKYRLFYRIGIKSRDATQRKTRQELLNLLQHYKIDFVYVDYGAGDTNIEELTLYGKDHPELGLNRKLRVIDSGASVQHFDPVLGKAVKKRNKSLMISVSVLNLEEGSYMLPKEEDEKTRLVGQMRGYQVKNVTSRGDYTYSGEDHILDAFNLAIYGFQKEYGSLLNNRAVYNVLFLNDPRLADYPQRATEEHVHNPVSTDTITRIRDPELRPPEKKRSFRPTLISRPFKRANIDTTGSRSI